MDGFDVTGIKVEHVYNLDTRTANYLLIAGYAEHAAVTAPHAQKSRRNSED